MLTQPAFSIAPALNEVTNSWSYLSNGYGKANSCSKYANPARVTSISSSASSAADSDSRQYTPNSMVRPSLLVNDPRSTWYGPATSAVTYGDRRGVAANRHTARWPPGECWPADDGKDCGVGEVDTETTFQCAGAVTVKVKVALRSG